MISNEDIKLSNSDNSVLSKNEKSSDIPESESYNSNLQDSLEDDKDTGFKKVKYLYLENDKIINGLFYFSALYLSY